MLFKCISLVISCLLVNIPRVYASTPSEMAEFSLQELFNLPVEHASNPWQVSLLYKQMRLEGYLDGRDSVENNQVLFDGSQARTTKNFPIVPTTILQEAFIINVSYSLDAINQIAISIPVIRQSTDHISIVPNYNEFNISSSGMGDIVLHYSGLMTRRIDYKLSYSLGLSLPLGSIERKGDTPRAAGEQQLPYTMQLGSGTWDLPTSLSYQYFGYDSWLLGVDLLAKVRLGKNSRSYRLGNRLSVDLWAKWQRSNFVQPFSKLTYQQWGTIKGQDDELLVPAAFVYPASITNPDYFGGKKLNATLGAHFKIKHKQHLNIAVSFPLYQDLNGIQPKEKYSSNIVWNVQF